MEEALNSVREFAIIVFILACLCLFHATPLPAQTTSQPEQNPPVSKSDLIKTNAAVLLNPFDDRYEGIEGSPFIFEGWKAGLVTVREDEQVIPFEGISLDAYHKVVWVRNEHVPPGIIEMENIARVEIDPEGEIRTFLIYPSGQIEGKKKGELTIYELLHEGDYTLLKEHGKKFYKASYQGAYSSDRRSDEYKDENRWYLKNDKGEFQKIKLRSGSVEKALSSHKQEIRQLTRQKDLDLGREADLVRLLDLLKHQ